MLAFKVGDKAVYPAHGVGVVQGIESTEIAGKKLPVRGAIAAKVGDWPSLTLYTGADGACKQAPAPTVTRTIGTNETTTWTAFLQGNGALPLDPGTPPRPLTAVVPLDGERIE